MGLTPKSLPSNIFPKKDQGSAEESGVIEGNPAKKRFEFISLLSLPALFTVVFIIIPLVLMLLYSFWTVEGPNIVPKWTIQHYLDFFNKPLFYNQAFKSIRVAIFVTLSCLILGFPVANYIANQPGSRKNFWLLLTLVPMWSSYVVRIYAWRTILGFDGLLNSFLINLHVLSEPTRAFSFNQLAVYITLTNYLLPFMISPLVATIEKIPRSQIDAARDLGSSPLDAVWHILIPLSLPGMFVGGMNVFVIALADYLTPKLVGGTDGLMIGNVIQSEFGAAFNWPLGSAATFITAGICLTIILTMRYLTHKRAQEVKF